ncbi:MAG: phospholipase A [Burkholderiaceae bacterium]|jgi:phospholipase A1
MPTPRRLLSLALAVAFPVVALAQGPAACAGLDDAKRLVCYDAIYRKPTEAPAVPVPVARNEPSALEAVATAPSGKGLAAGDYLTKFWELDPESKRGTFVVRTYAPNFLLPAHYSSNINKSPSSPTHQDGGSFAQYRKTEAELQLSLRSKVAENLFLPNADVWVAYTQQSIWQLWNGQDSAPFRSSDYQPEAMFVVPIPDKTGDLGGGWRWRMLTAGIAHESNGYGLPLSRSWNYVYLGTEFTHDDFALRARFNQRLGERGVDDNPHITDYIGNTELSAAWFPGEATMQLTGRTSFKSTRRGSLKFEWTRPVVAARPDGLRWYMQLFSGYGETMLDYNHRQNSIGLGFTLFQL